ncbi:MAG: ABC transporter ATP-binding protein [Clostridia bacterium]|nr:ABC transporter ATP-binding protein [Clostridia bacterium]
MNSNPYKLNAKLIASVTAVVVEGLLSGCSFLVLFKVLDIIFERSVQLSDIFWASAALALIILLRVVIYTIAYTGCQVGGSDVSRNIRIAIGDKLKSIPLGLFTKNRTGFYINAATSEVGDYEQILTHKVADIVKYSILLLAVGIYSTTLYLPIGLLILLSTFAVIPIMYLTIRQMRIYGIRKNLAREENVSAIAEYLAGSQTLRSYGLAGTKNQSLTQAMKDYSDVSYQYEAAIVPIGQSFAILSYLVLALSILLSVSAWMNGIITPATLIILIMMPLFTSKLNVTLYIAMTSYRNFMISKKKINRLFEEEEEGKNEQNADRICQCEIRFENVQFSYEPDEPVLANVSFTIPENKLTAIVGDSGSGKSTILNLLSRYYKPTAGDIKMGGLSIADMDPERVLSKMSLVDQDVFLFDDTVRDNIRYAKRHATDSEIEEACKIANCDRFIRSMEQGYETKVGENGNRLSGGERQRLSIARAILKNSPIILLDEATASLDIENELLVKQAIGRLLTKDKTVVMVAHTLPIVKHADQIIVLDNGSITECGTHEELIRKHGKYAAMWEASQRLA